MLTVNQSSQKARQREEELLETILVKHLVAGNDTTAWLKWLVVRCNPKVKLVAVGAVENYRVSYDPGFVPAMVDFNMHLNTGSVKGNSEYSHERLYQELWRNADAYIRRGTHVYNPSYKLGRIKKRAGGRSTFWDGDADAEIVDRQVDCSPWTVI
uniref:Uncharacterized protein n=1 Tax=Peronospora matthiolae TaxID=2874970 RepID=A0AAV1UCS9_9STRA